MLLFNIWNARHTSLFQTLVVRTCSGKIIIVLSDYYTTHRWRRCTLANTSSLTLYDICYMAKFLAWKCARNLCRTIARFPVRSLSRTFQVIFIYWALILCNFCLFRLWNFVIQMWNVWYSVSKISVILLIEFFLFQL